MNSERQIMRNRNNRGLLILLAASLGFVIMLWQLPKFVAEDKTTVSTDASTPTTPKSNADTDSPGAKLFKANCASCHYPDKDMTGPALKGARDRWIENSTEDQFYAWVKNPQNVVRSGDGYANALTKKWDKTDMQPQQVSDAQIDQIFEYIEEY